MEICTAYLVLIATFLVGIIKYYKSIYNFWINKNIPYDDENQFSSFFKEIFQREAMSVKFKNRYAACKAAGYKNFGLFILGKPILMPIDPVIIKDMLTKFINRGVYHNQEADPLGAHLFALDGQEWRNLRVKLTPTFTSGKMKMMIRTVAECGEQLKKSMDHLAALNEPFNVRDLAGMFTTDVIGSCAFGLDCNSFENPNSEFLKYSKQVFVDDAKRVFKGLIAFRFPAFAKYIGIYLTDKVVSNFFLRIVKETMEYREKNNVVRNDFMQLLLNLKNEPTENGNHHFTLEEVAAQAFLFFIAGYETSSSTMTFFLYELSINPDIQEKVREEINRVLDDHDGKVTYEAIMGMKYLGQTIDEALRKYPPLPILFRQNATDYKIPGTDQILEKGTSIFIPSIGLHYDPEYFPDPEKFDPDRFSEENKSKINPYTYLPFGEGPRNCIGLRFGVMQAKVGLTYLLKNYRFSLNEKTEEPLKMDPQNFMLSVLGGVWLNATKVE